jgi:hypothetical protein
MKLLTLVLGSVLICAGCGRQTARDEQGSPSSAPAAARRDSPKEKHDPCSLITKEEMEQVIGAGILEAKADGSRCNYLPKNAMEGSATILTTWDGAEARAMFAMKGGGQLSPTDATRIVSGLGDEATFALYTLNVRKGDAFFAINLALPNRHAEMMRQDGLLGPEKFNAALLEMDTALAKKALSRL